jgi:hypothetical protein
MKFFLKVVVVLLFSISVWADNFCINIFNKNDVETTTEVLQIYRQFDLDVVNQGAQSLLRFKTFRKVSQTDLTLVSLVMTVSGANFSMIKSRTPYQLEVHLDKLLSDADILLLSSSLNKTIEEISKKTLFNEPQSFMVKGDFDRLTPIEALHEKLFANQSPASFRVKYRTDYQIFIQSLPLALKAAFSTEYFLPGQDPNYRILASQIVQASFHVPEKTALKSLDLMANHFLQILEEKTPEIRRSIYSYGLVPLIDLLPRVVYAKYQKTKKEEEKPPTFASFLDFIDNTRTSNRSFKTEETEQMDFQYHGATETAAQNRKLKLDDLPPAVIDSHRILLIQEEFKIETVQQFAQIPVFKLMRYMGRESLTRDEIRDLYFYLRDNYGIYMNLSEELGLRLRIFTPY